jgi:hypothetical protein
VLEVQGVHGSSTVLAPKPTLDTAITLLLALARVIQPIWHEPSEPAALDSHAVTA